MNKQEENKAIIERMLDEIEQNGFVSQADFFAEQAINHGMLVPREMIQAVLQDIEKTFPDITLEPIHILAANDWVVVRCFFTGTHKGTGELPFVHEGILANVPPTGKRVKVQHIHMFRLEDGKIIEHWANRDDVGMLRQLGVSLN